MNVSREVKEELNKLSLEVFGAASRWQKLCTKGYTKVVTRKEKEVVPAAKEGDSPTEREIDVPVLRADGATQSTTEYHTVTSIRQYMLDRKEALEKIRAEIKRRQDETQAKKEQEQHISKVHQELQGSVV